MTHPNDDGSEPVTELGEDRYLIDTDAPAMSSLPDDHDQPSSEHGQSNGRHDRHDGEHVQAESEHVQSGDGRAPLADGRGSSADDVPADRTRGESTTAPHSPNAAYEVSLVTRTTESGTARFDASSDDVSETFEAMLSWYARQLDPTAEPEAVIEVLLSASDLDV